MLWEWSESEGCSVVSDSLWPHGLYNPWNSPGQNTGVGSLSLLQGIFQTQGLNPGLRHHRQILYQLNHKGSPKIDAIISHILAWLWMSYLRAKIYNLKSKYCSLQVSGLEAKKKTKKQTCYCSFVKGIECPTVSRRDEWVKMQRYHAQIMDQFWREGTRLRT